MYTKGKWEVEPEPGGHFSILADKSITVWRNSNAEDNAKRICQCVNGWDKLQKDRDELLEACKLAKEKLSQVKEYLNKPHLIFECYIDKTISKLEQAIANAEKE